MYEEFFGLTCSPFKLSPDPFFMVSSQKLQAAVASIRESVRQRKGFVVMTGEAGTGKTLVLRSLLELWEREEIPFAYFIGPKLSTKDFLSYMTVELGVKVAEPTKGNLLRALYGFLLAQFKKGRTTVLVVDEAHQIPLSVLEEIRVLANFETAQQKLLQVVLAGQPELEKRLDLVELRSLKQRVAVQCRLEPLSGEEVRNYIVRRLELAGLDLRADTIFPAETTKAIQNYSQGIPRLVNSICDHALMVAYAHRVRVVTVELIDHVAAHLRLDQMPVLKQRQNSPLTPSTPVQTASVVKVPAVRTAEPKSGLQRSNLNFEAPQQIASLSNNKPSQISGVQDIEPQRSEGITPKGKDILRLNIRQEAALLRSTSRIIKPRARRMTPKRAWLAIAALVVFAFFLGRLALHYRTMSTFSYQDAAPLSSEPHPDASRRNLNSALRAEAPLSPTPPSSKHGEDLSRKPAVDGSFNSDRVKVQAAPPITEFARPTNSSAIRGHANPPISPPVVAERSTPEAFPLSPAFFSPPPLSPPLIRPVVVPPDFALDRTLKAHTSWVTSLVFSSDGRRLASGSWDQTVKFWDVPSGDQLSTVGSKMKEVEALALSHDGRLLAAENSSNTVTLWDAATGRELHTLSAGKPVGVLGSSWVYSIAFSPDDRWLATGVDDETVRLWDVQTGHPIRDLTALRRSVIYAAFSPDGRWLASGDDDKSIRIWDVSTGREIRKLTGHKKPIYAVAFSPNGRWLASASADKTVKLWDISEGREIYTLRGHSSQVTSLAFSPDGRWLASGSWDKTIKIWDVETGHEVQSLVGHDHAVYTVAFDSRGQWLASGSEDGTIKLWRLGGLAQQINLRVVSP